ncbi:MAG: hypothetical protein WAU70_16225, partial [Flavobacteriales bacterium]
MKATFVLGLVLVAGSGRAQVLNGSFEYMNLGAFTDWNYTCECGYPTASFDTPGGTGTVSLDLTAEEQFCPCAVTFDLYQDLPWLTPGVWTLSYWIKGHDGIGPPAAVAVAFRTGLGFPPISNQSPGVTDTTWTYHQDVFNWDGIYPPLDSLLLMISAGASSNGERHAYFDDIQLTSFGTGGTDITLPRLSCYPVPATDHLTIGLSEAPLELIAYDAMGRRLRTLAFTDRGSTIDVVVDALPSGCVVLR